VAFSPLAVRRINTGSLVFQVYRAGKIGQTPPGYPTKPPLQIPGAGIAVCEFLPQTAALVIMMFWQPW
jgi:hypothetical protein